MLALRHRSQKDANRACVVELRLGGRKCSLLDCFAIEMTQTMLATWHCGLKDANHACLVRISDLMDGNRSCFEAAKSEGRKSSMHCGIATWRTQMIVALLHCD